MSKNNSGSLFLPIFVLIVSSMKTSGAVLVAGFDSFISTTKQNVTSASDGPLASTSTLSGSGFRSGASESNTLSYGGDPTLVAGPAGNGRYGLSTAIGDDTLARAASVKIANPISYPSEFHLDSFVFDARIRNASVSPTLILDVTYEINGGGELALGSATISTSSYSPFLFFISNTFAPGDTITFKVTQRAGQNGQILTDNIALLAVNSTSGIPEPTMPLMLCSFAVLAIRRKR